MKDSKKRAVTILLHNEDGDILAVSRKNDETDFGLPGGKVDEGETDEQAIIREVKEETGLDVYNISPYFTRQDGEFIGTTFIGNYKGELKTTEKGKVVWTDFETIKKGSFGKYNTQLEKFYNTTHKYREGDIVINPETSEAFLILNTANEFKSDNRIAVPGYFVNAFCSNIGHAFVKKTALDGIRMHSFRMDAEPSEKDLAEMKVLDLDDTTAQFFAISSHFDTNHYYGNNDSLLYSYHLSKVVNVGRRFKHLIPAHDWHYVESGLWNHDCIEDARKTFNDLKSAIGVNAAEISFALTNMTGKTRSERANNMYYLKICTTKYATFAKLCDRIANIEYSIKTGGSMLKKYKKEHFHFEDELREFGKLDEMWKHIEDLLGIDEHFKNLETERKSKLIELPLYPVTIDGIEKPVNLNGYYLIGYLVDSRGHKTVSVSVGDEVMIAGQKAKITEIRDQVTQTLSMDKTDLGWKHWMKFDIEPKIDCHHKDGVAKI